MPPYSVAFDICSFFISFSFFLILLKVILFVVVNNFKSCEVEFQERYLFFCVIMQCFSALVFPVILVNLFIYEDINLRLLFVVVGD